MALLFIDSFDNYNAPAIGALGKWQSYINNWSNNAAGAITVNPTGGRNSGSALECAVVPGGTLVENPGSYMQGVLGTALNRIVMGFAFNVAVFASSNEVPFLQFVDGTTGQVCVSFDSGGHIIFRSGTNTGAILSQSTGSVLSATNVYQYLEFDITFNSSTGAIVLHKNGVNVTLSASTGLNTAPSGNNTLNVYRIGVPGTDNFGGFSTSTCDYFFDDLYIVSTSGGQNTTFLGDVRAVCLFPSANSAVQLTPVGAPANWECVNQTSEDGDTTYVFGSVVGNKDLYAKQATPSNTGQIFGIQLCSVARKDDAGSRSCINVIQSGATLGSGATQQVSESYAWYLDIMEQDPNASSAWTKTTIDAATVGAEVGA